MNTTHALAASALRRPSALVAVTLVSGGLFLVAIWLCDEGASVGWAWPTFWAGLVRAVFGFSLGLLLRRTRPTWEPFCPTLPFWVLAGLLLFVLALPSTDTPWLASPWRDLPFVLVVLPALVMLGTKVRGTRLTEGLGALSYPLYSIHYPLVSSAALLLKRARIENVFLTVAVWSGIAALVLLFAGLCWRLIDKPLAIGGPRSSTMLRRPAPRVAP